MPRSNEDLDDDLDDDIEREDDDKGGEKEDPPALGDQDDGGFVVALGEGEEDDEKKVTKEDDEEGDDKSAKADEEELERKREARRQERQERKLAAREKQEKVRRQLDETREQLRQTQERLAAIERKSTGADMAQLENAESRVKKAVVDLEEELTRAGEAGDGKAIAQTTTKLIEARRQLDHIGNVKTAFKQRANAPQALDTRMVTHANKFMADHAWYRPEGTDRDSRITRIVDEELAAEGYDPRTQDYWVELADRVKKALPHRFKSGKVQNTDTDDDDDPPRKNSGKPKSVVTGSGRDSQAGTGGKAVFKLSADRVSAMKEAGIWDDEKARNEAIKRYRAYDKQAANSNKG